VTSTPKLLTLHGWPCAGDFDQFPYYGGAATYTDQQLSIIGRRLGADFGVTVETLDTYPELLGAARQVLSAPELLGAAKDPGKKIGAGAGTGGAIGAAVGSVIPGLGTAIGGAVGTVVGTIGGIFAAFGGKKKKKKKKVAVVNPQTGQTQIKEIITEEPEMPVSAIPGLPAVPARGASAPAVATAQKLAAVDAAGKGKTVILAGAAIGLLALIMLSKKKGG